MGGSKSSQSVISSESQYVSHIDKFGQQERVITHLTEVAEMAGKFAKVFDCQGYGQLEGLYHDIGKYSKEFQYRILSNGPVVDHSTAGAKVLFDYGDTNLLPYCIAGHHGGLPDGGDSGDDGITLIGRLKNAINGYLPDYSAYETEVTSHPTDACFANNDLGWIGLLPDSQQQKFSIAFLVRMLFSCLVDADYLCTERFMNDGMERKNDYDDVSVLRDIFEKKINDFYPPHGFLNEYRCSVLDDCLKASFGKPGVYKLTVPTGGGKTYASMRFAINHITQNNHVMRRVIVCEPYMSIIEQASQTYRDIFDHNGKHNVLEHHSNVVFDEKKRADEIGGRELG